MQVIQKIAIQNHPCFNEQAHDRVGRIHLPVAPKCNIQCNFCERKMCINSTMQHPGWTADILSAQEALDQVHSIAKSGYRNFVVGIAGPGDPLANAATYETLKLIHHEYPNIIKCLSTNGLLLFDKLEQLVDAGIAALTVTINALDIDVGQRIYDWVRYNGKVYRGREAADLLITKQFQGITKAVEAGLKVKVNTVLIPGINDNNIIALAEYLSAIKIELMNIMPLIPCGKMRDFTAPTCEQIDDNRKQCEPFIRQFRRCEHCRADIVYLPGYSHSMTHQILS